eukprot:scaffold28999_cov94-Phaeocystis_antarctica.AAC.1
MTVFATSSGRSAVRMRDVHAAPDAAKARKSVVVSDASRTTGDVPSGPNVASRSTEKGSFFRAAAPSAAANSYDSLLTSRPAFLPPLRSSASLSATCEASGKAKLPSSRLAGRTVGGSRRSSSAEIESSG